MSEIKPRPKMMTADNFKKQMAALSKLFEKKLTDDQLIIYWQELNNPGWTDELFNTLCKMVIRSEYRFPPIAAFFRAFEELMSDQFTRLHYFPQDY